MSKKSIAKRSCLSGERDAKCLSADERERARCEYYDKGEILFLSGMSNDKKFGEELLERIEKLTQKIRTEASVPLSPFSNDDVDAIICALTLPAELHYNEFEYVGIGGDYDNGRYRRQEEWSGCDLTELRKRIVQAIVDLCLHGEALAVKLHSLGGKEALAHAHITVCRECIESEIPDANLSKKRLKMLLGGFMLGLKPYGTDNRYRRR